MICFLFNEKKQNPLDETIAFLSSENFQVAKNYIVRYTNKIIKKILVGNGGDAGGVNIRYRTINGKFEVKTCAGVGSLPARNGVGGTGNMLYVHLKDNNWS